MLICSTNVAKRSVRTATMYRGVITFIIIQLMMLVIAYQFPALITWLPNQVYGS